jgi:murein DD-endopeptidase MepM/ murein hydrolase activator NlpD
MTEPSKPLPSRRELRNRQQSLPTEPTTPTQALSLALTPTRRAEAITHRGWGQKVLSISTLIAAPLLFIGVSLPANVFYSSNQLTPAIASEPTSTTVEDDQSQSFVASSSQASLELIERESWSVTSYAEVLRARYGGRTLTYQTTGQGPVRWPFPVAVPISSGFGARVAPCKYCSSYHRGVDFTPGRGTPIYSIADGVVTQSEYGGGYGQHAYVEHEINGQTVLSVYAHMISGSSPLQPGDRVEVGDFIGLVGNTGVSTGPHLHFEIRIDGVYLDPFAWLEANAQ